MSISKKLAAGVVASAVPVLLSANPAAAVDFRDTVTDEFTTTVNGQDYTCEVEASSRLYWMSPNDPEHPAPEESTILVGQTVVVPSPTCDVDVVVDSMQALVSYRPEGSDRSYDLGSNSLGPSGVHGSWHVPGIVTDTEFSHVVRYYHDDGGGSSGVPFPFEVTTDPNPK